MGLSPEKFEKVMFLQEFVLRIFAQDINLFKFTKKKNFSMVDIGTGPGTLLLRVKNLLPEYYKEIIGTDRSEAMIQYFNSVPRDDRITGSILDISDDKMPRNLSNRFDFAFSSFCLGYVPDLKKAFKNCHKLLKPEGETFFVWGTRSQIPEIFRSLSRIQKWAPYTSDYKNWKSLIEYEDPVGILQNHLNLSGLNTVKIEEYEDFVFEESEDDMLEALESLDHICCRIPHIDRPKYKKDFCEIIRSELMVEEKCTNGTKILIPCPAVSVITSKY